MAGTYACQKMSVQENWRTQLCWENNRIILSIKKIEWLRETWNYPINIPISMHTGVMQFRTREREGAYHSFCCVAKKGKTNFTNVQRGKTSVCLEWLISDVLENYIQKWYFTEIHKEKLHNHLVADIIIKQHTLIHEPDTYFEESCSVPFISYGPNPYLDFSKSLVFKLFIHWNGPNILRNALNY